MPITDVLSIQLYTLRSLGHLDAIVDAAAAAGFRHVETVGAQLDDAAATRARLDARGLTAPTSHVGLATLRAEPDRVVEACRILGCEQIYMPAAPAAERSMPPDGWRALGEELGRLAERLRPEGIRLGYHNHDWELRVRDGDKTGLDLIFEGSAGSPLAWQADIAWLVRGGADPKDWLARYGDRLLAAHVKDIAPAGQKLDEDGWTEIGAGVLDWPDLWRACRDAGAQWMVVEHDKPADPVRTARESFAYLSGMRV